MTFISHSFLYLLPLSLLPILIHLFFRKKPKIIKFSNNPILENVIKQRMKRSKLKYIILLITRCLILFSLILIFSRPVFYYIPFAHDKTKTIYILLDSSYSMSCYTQGKTKFQIAKELCYELIKLLECENVKLVVFSNKIERIIDVNRQRELLEEMVMKIEPTYRTTNFIVPISEILKNEKNNEIILILLSDLAEHMLPENQKMLDTQKKISLLLVPIGECRENIYIRDVSLKEPLFISTIIDNTSNKKHKTTIELYVKNRKLSEIEVFLTPNTPYTYNSTYPQEGGYGYIKIQNDYLIEDNIYYFTLKERKQKNILIIDEDEKPISIMSDSYFIMKALEKNFDLKRVTPSNLKHIRLQDYDVFITVNLKNFPTEIKDKKSIVFLGDKINQASYSNVLGLNLGDISKKEQNLTWVDISHPIFKELNIDEFEYKKITAKKAYKIETAKENILSCLEDTTPFICNIKEKFILNTSANTSFSNLAVKPLFSPLLNSLIIYLQKDEKLKKQILLDETFVYETKIKDLISIEIINPLNIVDRFFKSKIEYTKTDIPGIYTIRSNTPNQIIEEYFAVNLDTERESNLKEIKIEKIQEVLPNSKIKITKTLEDIKKTLYGKEITSNFFYLLIGLLFLEFILANPVYKVFKKSLPILLVSSFIFAEYGNYFKFSQIKYQGHWDPYPDVHKDIISLIHLTTSIKSFERRYVLTLNDPDLFLSPFIFILGADDFPKLSESEVSVLRKYIYSGGTIFIEDTSCNRESNFDKRIREELKRILPEKELEFLPMEHPIFKSYYLIKKLPGRRIIKNYIEGVNIDGRTAIIYSRNDLFGSFAKDKFGNYVWKIPDKQRIMAQRLLLNIIVFSVTGTYKSDDVHQPFIKKKLEIK